MISSTFFRGLAGLLLLTFSGGEGDRPPQLLRQKTPQVSTRRNNPTDAASHESKEAEEDNKVWMRLLQFSMMSLVTAAPTGTKTSTPTEPVPTSSPTPNPTLTREEQNKVITCISIIDESSNFASSGFDAKWNQFRTEYPERPFCLLQPQSPSQDFDDLFIPDAFSTDGNTILVAVNRDGGDASLASDYFSECNLAGLRDEGITNVAIFVDNSGSMRTGTVQASLDLLNANLEAEGITLVAGIENTAEDWVSPFLTNFLVDEGTTSPTMSTPAPSTSPPTDLPTDSPTTAEPSTSFPTATPTSSPTDLPTDSPIAAEPPTSVPTATPTTAFSTVTPSPAPVDTEVPTIEGTTTAPSPSPIVDTPAPSDQATPAPSVEGSESETTLSPSLVRSWGQEARLLVADTGVTDRVGTSVDVNGDTAIVGSSGGGGAHIYIRSDTMSTSWDKQTTLTADDGALLRSVAIDGDIAVAGASTNQSAYVFVRSDDGSWSQEAKLTGGTGAGVTFGFTVAISGETIIVGENAENEGRSGIVFVFVRSGMSWTQQAELTAQDGGAGDLFGRRVALSGDTAIIGAQWDEPAGSRSGSAYIFVRTASVWAQQAKLIASDAKAGDWFGFSVGIDDDTAIIGALFFGFGGQDRGGAYIFVRDGESWVEQARIVASDGTRGDKFGSSVDIIGNRAIVGARGDVAESGSLYIFQRTETTWAEEAKLFPGDRGRLDNFGVFAATSDSTVIVATDSVGGKVYIFDELAPTLPPATLPPVPVPVPVPNPIPQPTCSRGRPGSSCTGPSRCCSGNCVKNCGQIVCVVGICS